MDKIRTKTALARSICAALALLSVIALSSAEIAFTASQSEYYFLVGEDALINLHASNNGTQPVGGMISYTVSTSVRQGGFSYQSSNTNSKSLTILPGAQDLAINLGTSDAPLQMDLDMSFSYSADNGTQMLADMPRLRVIFVQDESQKQNSQNQQTSQSKTQEQIEQERQQAREEAERQREEQLRQQMQQQVPDQMQNRMQNNQMSQSTQGLKQEIQQQQQSRDDFVRNLQTKEEFKQMAKQLADRGFNMTSADINAQDSRNGNFSMVYENGEGEKRTLEGSMKNDTIDRIEIKEPEEQGMAERAEERPFSWWLLLPLLAAALLSFFLARRLMRRKFPATEEKSEGPFDHTGASLAMLKEAEQLFEEGSFKDAYAKASEAVRLYYAHELGLKRELTATELVKELKSRRMGHARVRECLNLCGLVEFAKYSANKQDFGRIVRTAKDLINRRGLAD